MKLKFKFTNDNIIIFLFILIVITILIGCFQNNKQIENFTYNYDNSYSIFTVNKKYCGNYSYIKNHK